MPRTRRKTPEAPRRNRPWRRMGPAPPPRARTAAHVRRHGRRRRAVLPAGQGTPHAPMGESSPTAPSWTTSCSPSTHLSVWLASTGRCPAPDREPALAGARRRLGLRRSAYARKVRHCYTSLEDMPPAPYQAMAGAVSVLLLRGRSCCLARGGHVQQDHGVVVSGTGLGEVDAQALTGRTFQLHALKA